MNDLQHILLVDDDDELAAMLKEHFIDMGYRISRAADGVLGRDMALTGSFDVVVLDVGLPKLNGFDVLRELRAQQNYIPVLMLTSHADDADKVAGLELGADDYLTKPFKLPELRARVRALLRRVEGLYQQILPEQPHRLLDFDKVMIHLDERRVVVRGNEVQLTPLEFDMLVYLASEPGKVRSRDNIVQEVWGYSIEQYDASINSLMRRLRSKIEADPNAPTFILTVRGVGYRFATKDELGIVERES